MGDYSISIAAALRRTFYAVSDRPLFGESADYAAQIFEVLLDYHGLEIVSNCGFVVSGDVEDGDLSLVRIEDDGSIRPPKLQKPYTPELARRLGIALIGAARQSDHARGLS